MVALSEKVKAEIDHWLIKFPNDERRSAVVAALLAAQAENGGWLSDELMEAVAGYLDIPKIEVFEVATFYDMYELKPIGRHKIGLCTNISCHLRGASDIAAALTEKLGIGFGETTSDGLITLRETECLGACANAPVCQLDNGTFYEDLTREKIGALIDDLTKEGVRGE